jgi:hypothetical protein
MSVTPGPYSFAQPVPTAVVDNAVPPIAASGVRRFNSVAIVSSRVKAGKALLVLRR